MARQILDYSQVKEVAYCRCDGSSSDFYMYSTGDGLTLHVPVNIFNFHKNRWTARHQHGLNQTYYFTHAEEALGFLLERMCEGWRVPGYTLKRLRREINEGIWDDK